MSKIFEQEIKDIRGWYVLLPLFKREQINLIKSNLENRGYETKLIPEPNEYLHFGIVCQQINPGLSHYQV